MPLPLKPLPLAVLAALAASAHAAPAPAPATDAHDLDTVTVTATRTERTLAEVPNTVSVIEREQLDRQLVRDLKDLVRYEPGVSVGSGTGRFGLKDIRVRGLGGNRVRIETDGIAVSDSFAIGSFSDANRNFVDLDTLKRVEIVRGPASALYGSDALGGVVAFVTKDPADDLAPGRDAHFDVKLGYESDWQGLFAGATLALGGERWSGLLALGHRQGTETRNQGTRAVDGALRTTPNPQERNGRSLLAKLVFEPDTDQRWRLTVEGNEDETDTDVRHLLGFQPRTRATTLSLIGDDHQTRARISLAHEHDALGSVLADRMQWQVYRQDSETTQATVEHQRNAAGVALRREREFDFDQRVLGMEAVLHKDFATGTAQHALTWGLELTRTEVRQKRDGRAITLATGQVTRVVPPDVFPVRDFPPSEITNAALFVQDEVALADGRLRLVPGLRVDRYALRPQPDPIFAEDNPGIVPADITETSVAPKFGAVWTFAEDWSVFGNYARGFRSPPYNDVNLGFTNLQHGYATIPNPDLKPETSDGFELGLRHAGPALHASLAVFHNRYDDFIESGVLVSAPPASPIRVFQSRNVAEATIEGLEFKAGFDFGAWREALRGLRLQGAAAWQRGEDARSGRPLASVDPARAALGLSYDAQAWGIGLHGRFARRQRRMPDLTPGVAQFTPPGHAVFDLLAHWDFAPGATLDLGVFNLTDRKYWDWADVGGLTAADPALDRYTRPGRSLALSVAFAW
ncbi:TonB-dependent hemoglobin/transferrin/lactoferrin family receptor [Vulcaniibacterium gelatinicum]|uniref:TonB-dependent hemoglobin/transferrin/lactoferrin family receptor n=1 Tax=Vulcaniibacterium gelatinicum TaxID=2598725 RepID=UPI0011CCA43F|nr:TonB-dependent hemoglobin/transferrin/lactoferrin family receptor [Vulcaniibacterium gelatinicum]